MSAINLMKAFLGFIFVQQIAAQFGANYTVPPYTIVPTVNVSGVSSSILNSDGSTFSLGCKVHIGSKLNYQVEFKYGYGKPTYGLYAVDHATKNITWTTVKADGQINLFPYKIVFEKDYSVFEVHVQNYDPAKVFVCAVSVEIPSSPGNVIRAMYVSAEQFHIVN